MPMGKVIYIGQTKRKYYKKLAYNLWNHWHKNEIVGSSNQQSTVKQVAENSFIDVDNLIIWNLKYKVLINLTKFVECNWSIGTLLGPHYH